MNNGIVLLGFINHLRTQVYEDEKHELEREFLSDIEEAVQLQLAKPPYLHEVTAGGSPVHYYDVRCGACGNKIGRVRNHDCGWMQVCGTELHPISYSLNYCSCCGQKIEWGSLVEGSDNT